MKKKFRTWFDDAYNFTHGVLPFWTVTAPLNKRDIYSLIQLGLDNELLKKILEEVKKFYRHLPTTGAFLEEKERLYPQIVGQFQRFMPFVDSAITFGRIRGDIDIALISKRGISPTDLEKTIKENQLTNLFPIVDWNGIFWFYSTGGLEVYNRIFESRLIINNTIDYKDVKENIEASVENARLLYGDIEELKKMQSPFNYKKKIIQNNNS